MIQNRIIFEAHAAESKNLATSPDGAGPMAQSSVFARLQALENAAPHGTAEQEGYYAAPETGGRSAVAETEFGDDGPIMLNPVMSLEETVARSAGKSSNTRPGFAKSMYAPTGQTLGGDGTVADTDWDSFVHAVTSPGLEPFKVTVSPPLGMRIDGSSMIGHFVKACTPGSASEAAGIKAGHRILAVNETEVDRLEKKQVAALIRQSTAASEGQCLLTLAEDLTGYTAYLQAAGKVLDDSMPGSQDAEEPEPTSMAAFALETFELTAQLPLGMDLQGSATSGYFVKGLLPGGPAEKSNLSNPRCYILARSLRVYIHDIVPLSI